MVAIRNRYRTLIFIALLVFCFSKNASLAAVSAAEISISTPAGDPDTGSTFTSEVTVEETQGHVLEGGQIFLVIALTFKLTVIESMHMGEVDDWNELS